ncbi:protein kinase [Chloroflexota bacterium]
MAEKVIGEHYQLQDELGVGGMGTVYYGVDRRTRQPVAIKQLKPALIDTDLLERFRREGQALRDLNHPNIVKLLDTIEQDGQHYLVMEYVSGGDLKQRMEQGRLSLQDILLYALDLADALTRAHRLNIIHRDLKPANVLLADDGTLRLTDFGVARFGSQERLTNKGTIFGTVDYLPPEALNNKGVDARSDIWSFGVMLFEMLSGEKPFDDDTLAAKIKAILTDPLPDLGELASDIPPALVNLVNRMLERNRADRVSSVRVVGAELEAILYGQESAEADLARQIAIDGSLVIDWQPARQQLPIPTTSFVGREAELTELDHLIGSPHVRQITILAPGGMGKTRLTLEAARQAMQSYADGVYFVELAPLVDAVNIVTAIAKVTGYESQGDRREAKQQLLDFLGRKRALLVLDNFEHLLEGAGIVADILQAAPDITILVTSRRRLNQPGETLFHLGGLVFPGVLLPEDASDYAAMQLFANSGQRVNPAFALTANNIADVARVCDLVGGVPLGIELAASWLSMLSPGEIAAEISKDLDFLATDGSDSTGRQRSIRSVLDYSWGMMTGAEQEAMKRLSVFRGGFTREAVGAVAGANLQILRSLVNKSLVQRAAAGRYDLHQLLLQYSAEKLAANPQEQTTTLDRHCAYYAAFVWQRTDQLKGKGQLLVLNEISVEMMNIRLGWQRTLTARQFEKTEQYMEGLYLFHEMRFMNQDALEIFDVAITWLEDGEDGPPAVCTEQKRLYALALTFKCLFSVRMLKYQGTRALIDKALNILNQVGEQQDRAILFYVLALVDYHSGNYAKAEQRLQESLAIYDEVGDLWGKRRNRSMLSRAAYRLGDYEKAQELLEQNIRLSRASGDEDELGLDLCLLGQVFLVVGKYERAEQQLQEALAIYKKLDAPWGIAYAMKDLGDVVFRQGKYVAARRILHESLEGFTVLGVRRYMAITHSTLGKVASALNEYPAARTHFHKALQLATATSAMPETLDILVSVAVFFADEGNQEQALELAIIVLQRSTVSYETNRTAEGLVAKLEVALAPETTRVVWDRALSLDLEATINDLLQEFSGDA